jgi:uncharacterized membrane protein
MLIAYLFGLLLIFLLSFEYLIILLPVFLSKYLMGRYFNKWIGALQAIALEPPNRWETWCFILVI